MESASTTQPVQPIHINADGKAVINDGDTTASPPPTIALAADKTGDKPTIKQSRWWPRILGAFGVIAVGAGFIIWGAATFQRSTTTQIPAQPYGNQNTVKIEVDQRSGPVGVDRQGLMKTEPYFTTCAMTATYGYWDFEPSLAELSAQPDDYWPQEISAVLPLANPADKPSRLTLVLVGTAALPNGLAEPSITWTRLSDGQQVNGETVEDTAQWSQPHPGDYLSFKIPDSGIQFQLRFDSGYLVVGHEGTQLRILFRSEVKSPVGVVQGVRTTVNLPLMWGISWGDLPWGNPACGTTTAAVRLKGSLTNSAQYRLDSGTAVGDGYEITRTVKAPQDYFYGTTIYSIPAPQLSFIDRNEEASAQRQAAIATSLLIAAGLGTVPLGLQVFPWRAIIRGKRRQ